eukprot:TRINITY_DN15491_c0_g1_i1.p1 TRINITY_DN15491_c0_g1~~TRINITY_DN15491_c0_g1_i1.p1  ORF type:complete len:403 (-),score=46.74 TRINITY_DN15491_c0_g1_i1:15-1223(-)
MCIRDREGFDEAVTAAPGAQLLETVLAEYCVWKATQNYCYIAVISVESPKVASPCDFRAWYRAPCWALVRDSCCCERCFDKSCGARRFVLAEVATTPRLVEPIGDLWRVTWADGHKSSFAECPEVTATVDGPLVAPLYDNPAESPATPQAVPFSPLSSADNSSMVARVRTQLASTGYVVVSELGVAQGALHHLATALGTDIRGSEWGPIQDLRPFESSTTPGESTRIPPHADLVSDPRLPRHLLLHAIKQVPGGYSMLIDGMAIAQRFAAEHPQHAVVLATIPVGFRYNGSSGEPSEPVWRHVLHCGEDGDVSSPGGQLTGLRFDNHYQQPCGSEQAGAWYEAFMELQRAVLDPANQTRFVLQEGDAVVVNNHRMLHGRAVFPLDGNSQSRHLQLCYIDVHI